MLIALQRCATWLTELEEEEHNINQLAMTQRVLLLVDSKHEFLVNDFSLSRSESERRDIYLGIFNALTIRLVAIAVAMGI